MLSMLLATAVALHPCQPPHAAEPVLCGKVTVFEDRARRAGRTIDLHVVVLPALQQKDKREPLFDLAGGPGAASTDGVQLYTTELRPYRAHRDVVLVDQRGTGTSNGLNCKRDETPLAIATGEMYPLPYVRACRDELMKRADLTMYTTPIAMDDLDDVRAALGYDTIDLLGISYGTRAALVYARQHRAHVNRIALIGATPVWATLPLYHAANAQHALDLVLDDAERDGLPNLRAHFRDLLDRLRKQPARVTYEGETAALSAAVFTERIRSMLYVPATARGVPKLIDAATHGNFGPFLREIVGSSPPIADGMYLSVTCAEDTARIDPAEAKRVTAGTYFGDYRVVQQRRACREWPQATLPANYWDDVRVDAPVLLLTGYRDPVSAPAWADAIAQQLPNARNIVLERSAHLPIGLAHLECLDAIIEHFLDGDEPDTSCIETMQ